MYDCRIKKKKVVPSALVFTESVSFSLPFASRTKSFVLSRSVSYRKRCHRARTAVQRRPANHEASLIIGEPSFTSSCIVQIQSISHPLLVPAYVPFFLIRSVRLHSRHVEIVSATSFPFVVRLSCRSCRLVPRRTLRTDSPRARTTLIVVFVLSSW